MLNTRTLWAVAFAVALGAAGAYAEEPAAPAATDAPAASTDAAAADSGSAASGSDSSGSDSGSSAEEGGAAAAAPAPPVKPRPAEMMPLASKSLLLGIVNTGQHVVAVGDRGNIVVSNDGEHWAQVDVPVRATLTAVTFIDDKTGWAVGHDATVLHTGDGGKTWQLQNFQPELEKPLLAVYFADAQHGLAVGAYGLMLHTTDGGTSWSELEASAIREDELHLNSISKLGNGELFITGEQGLLGISKDGGATWEKLPAPYDGSLYGALPKGDKGALVFGLRGNVYATDDVRSNKWTKVDIGSATSMFGGTALPNGEIALVGLSGVAAILKSDGSVQQKKIEAMAGTLGTGTLSAAIPWKDQVLAVGELGVAHINLN
jgi:photosystem II stability/assembly factor-like uncharacterized protein